MDWVKLAQRYYLDPAIRSMPDDLADAAEVMFTRGLARAGEVGRHGFIPEQDIELLTRRRRYAAVVSALTGSGLWQAVSGGYQVTRWADWQDHLDALTRKRAADRERQRRRRAAAHNGRPPSRDMSHDVTAGEGEGEQEKEGGRGREVPHAARDPAEPPPQTCDRHPDGTDDPCRACQRRREAHERWQRDQATAAAQRTRTAARCTRHPQQSADRCGPCRSERLARQETP